MKKLSKLIFSCAAVAALTAAVGTVAMAAGELNGKLDYADGKLTIGEYDSTGEQQTILVLNKDAETVADTDIVQIDQQGEKFGTVTVGSLTDGTYYVRIGGSNGGAYLSGEFKVGGGDEPSTRLLGNVDDNTLINANDAAIVVAHSVAAPKTELRLTGDKLQAADVDENTVVNANDAAEIVAYAVNNPSKVDGKKTVAEKTTSVPED